MTDEIRPTGEDLARDLRADLTTVEAATPGPWVRVPQGGGWKTHDEALCVGRPVDGVVPDDPADLTYCMRHERVVSGWGAKRPDIEAIAAMRDGWPAAIRRALVAEAKVVLLNDSLALLGAVTAAKHDELGRLRAALEGLGRAAGDVTVTDGDTTCSLGRWVNEVLKGGTR